MQNVSHSVTGILLAAGKGTRFDATGRRNKLVQRLPYGDMVAVQTARTLLSVLSKVVAVVRPGTIEIERALRAAGCTVVQCPHADQGMGASLSYALSHVRDSTGWVIALADMPTVHAQTIAMLADAIKNGASIAVPVHQKRRGNPVAFGAEQLSRLLLLDGDKGARDLLRQYPVSEVHVNDPGIHLDIDSFFDLVKVGRMQLAAERSSASRHQSEPPPAS